MARTIAASFVTFPRQSIGRLFGIAAIAIMLVSGLSFRWERGQPSIITQDSLNLLALAAASLAISLWLLRSQSEVAPVTCASPQMHAMRRIPVILGAAALLLTAEASSGLILPGFQLLQHLQAIYFFGGSLLIAYGLGAFEGFRRQDFFQPIYIPLLLITLLALGLRVWNLGESVHIMVDELHFYDGVIRLWQNPNQPLLQNLDYIAAFPHIFSYFQQWTVALFGADFTGIRMTSALFGTLTIPAVYLFGRAISDHKTGLLAAALLAVFPPHLHFSRLALNNIADPLFGTLALAFLVFGLRSNRQRDYVLAGLFLGFTAYFYEGGRLAFTGLFVIWVGVMVFAARPWKHRRNILLMALMAILVLAPYYYTILGNAGELAPRLMSQGAFGYLLRDLREQPVLDVLSLHFQRALAPTISHTIYAPDGSEFYYGGYTALILWYIVPFFLLGFFYALFKMRGWGLLLCLWIVLGLVGVSFSVPSNWSVRYCVIFPALAVSIAIGLRYPLEAVTQNLVKRRDITIALAILVLGIGIAQLSYYFGDHLKTYNQQVRLDRYDFYDAFDRAAQIPSVSTIIYASESGIFNPVLDSSRPFRGIEMVYELWHPSEGLADKLDTLSHDNTYVFAIAPSDRATHDVIDAVFPLSPPLPWSVYSSVPLDRQYALYLYQPPSRP